jgi:hypothetical protein
MRQQIEQRRKSHTSKRGFIEVAVRVKPNPQGRPAAKSNKRHASRRQSSTCADDEPEDDSTAVKIAAPNAITLTSYVENPNVMAQGEDAK